MEQTIVQEKRYIVDSVDATSWSVSGWKLSVVFIVLTLLVLPWLQMRDLLTVPAEVHAAQNIYQAAMAELTGGSSQSLLESRTGILKRIDALNRLPDITAKPVIETMSLPLFLSFCEGIAGEGFGFSPISDLPNESTWICYKEQEGVWPLKILVSLELRVLDSFKIELVRLRRGERELPLEYAMHYFAKESAQMQPHLPLASGIRNFSCSQEAGKGWILKVGYRAPSRSSA
ncbi:MAG: hypothetical protein K0S07_516 [Chlamydiales bacterium]|jgi:hypothetical protein|nr:hypothetical protein [Chlamydiales bacterium]